MSLCEANSALLLIHSISLALTSVATSYVLLKEGIPRKPAIRIQFLAFLCVVVFNATSIVKQHVTSEILCKVFVILHGAFGTLIFICFLWWSKLRCEAIYPPQYHNSKLLTYVMIYGGCYFSVFMLIVCCGYLLSGFGGQAKMAQGSDGCVYCQEAELPSLNKSYDIVNNIIRAVTVLSIFLYTAFFAYRLYVNSNRMKSINAKNAKNLAALETRTKRFTLIICIQTVLTLIFFALPSLPTSLRVDIVWILYGWSLFYEHFLKTDFLSPQSTAATSPSSQKKTPQSQNSNGGIRSISTNASE